MKKSFEDRYVVRGDLRLDKELMMEYKQNFLIFNMSFKIPFKIIYWVKQKRKNIFGCMM